MSNDRFYYLDGQFCSLDCSKAVNHPANFGGLQ